MPGAEAARAELDWVVRLIGEVRAVRSEMNVPPSALAPVLLRDARAGDAGPRRSAGSRRSAAWRRADRSSGRSHGALPPGSAQAVLDEATVVLPLAGIIDLDAERTPARQGPRQGRRRGARRSRASSTTPISSRRAPPEVVEENRERLAGFEQEIARLDAALARITPVPA